MNVRLVEAGANFEGSNIPQKVHLEFRRKAGDAALFGSIVNDAMKNKMNMFVNTPPTQ